MKNLDSRFWLPKAQLQYSTFIRACCWWHNSAQSSLLRFYPSMFSGLVVSQSVSRLTLLSRFLILLYLLSRYPLSATYAGPDSTWVESPAVCLYRLLVNWPIVEYPFCNIYLRCCLSALNEKTQRLCDYWYCSRTFHGNSYWSQYSVLCKV
jgi:hypothetical protein